MSQNGDENYENQTKCSSINSSTTNLENINEAEKNILIKNEKEFIYFTPFIKRKRSYIPETPTKNNRILEGECLIIKGKNLLAVFESV